MMRKPPRRWTPHDEQRLISLQLIEQLGGDNVSAVLHETAGTRDRSDYSSEINSDTRAVKLTFSDRSGARQFDERYRTHRSTSAASVKSEARFPRFTHWASSLFLLSQGSRP